MPTRSQAEGPLSWSHSPLWPYLVVVVVVMVMLLVVVVVVGNVFV